MRTIALALACILAVACGVLIAGRSGLVVAALVLSLAVVVSAWARSLAKTHVGNDPPRGYWGLAAAALVALGLLRGASVGAEPAPRVLERGWPTSPTGASLREFEVVGASEPGVRCVVELRDPRAPRGPTLRVAAPPERCPLAAGQRVAVSAQALAVTWREALEDRDAPRDLGPGPVVWLRPSADPRGLERIRVGYWRAVASLRQRAWASTRGDPEASLVVAVGLGLRSALAPDERERLRAAGLGHLIAVSGLHVAVAALWLQALARRGVVLLGGAPRWACVIAWIPLWAYVGLTGGAASAIRAAVMLTGLDLAILSGRARHGPTLLAVTAAAMLFWRPAWLLDPGFGLSLAAMAAIVTAPDRAGVLALSWRITWATAPLSVLWFDAAPLHGLLGNAVALPLFALLMPLALLAALAPGGLGALALSLAKLGAAPILDLAGLLAQLPAAGPRELLVLAGLGLVLHRRRRRRARAEPAPAWLPGRLACALGLGVGLSLTIAAGVEARRARVEPAALEFDWVALGSVRARALILADPSAPASACLVRPSGSPATYLALLELLEVRRLTRVDARRPQPEEPGEPGELDPASAALVERLEHAGVERVAGGACPLPPAERVRAGLKACRARQGGRGRALVRSRAGVISCRIEDRWVVAAELL